MTADLICQSYFNFSHSTLYQQKYRECHNFPEAIIFWVFFCVRVDMLKDKKLQNLPEPVKCWARVWRLAGPGRWSRCPGLHYDAIPPFTPARPEWGEAGRVDIATAHQLQWAFFFLIAFCKIEIIWWDEQKLTPKKYFYPSMTNNKWSKLSQFWTSLSVVYRRVRRAYVGCPAPNSSENSFSFNQIINLTKRLQVWV